MKTLSEKLVDDPEKVVNAVVKMTKNTLDGKIKWVLAESTANLAGVDSGDSVAFRPKVITTYKGGFKSRIYEIQRLATDYSLSGRPHGRAPEYRASYALTAVDELGKPIYSFPSNVALEGLFAAVERQVNSEVSDQILSELLED